MEKATPVRTREARTDGRWKIKTWYLLYSPGSPLPAEPVVFAASLWPLHTRNRGLFVSLSGFASLCGHQREQGSQNDRMSAHSSPNTHKRRRWQMHFQTSGRQRFRLLVFFSPLFLVEMRNAERAIRTALCRRGTRGKMVQQVNTSNLVRALEFVARRSACERQAAHPLISHGRLETFPERWKHRCVTCTSCFGCDGSENRGTQVCIRMFFSFSITTQSQLLDRVSPVKSVAAKSRLHVVFIKQFLRINCA